MMDELLLKNYIEKEKSFCCSPYSFNSLLYCLKENSIGKNHKQLSDYLGSFQPCRQKEKCLKEDNFIVLNNEFYWHVLESFRVFCQKFNFDLLYNNTENISGYINNRVYQNTNGKISDLVKPEYFLNDFLLALINSIYFKDEWAFGFEKENYLSVFSGEETKTQHYFIRSKYFYDYYEDDSIDLVKIPFSENYYIYVFLPKISFFGFLSKFNFYKQKINEVRSNHEVIFKIPEFKIESTINLIPLIKNKISNILNLNKDWEILNFNGLNAEAVLAVNEAKQKTFFELNEKGVEAASATYIQKIISGCLYLEPPKQKYFTVDKPFCYLLTDQFDNDLFLGYIRNF